MRRILLAIGCVAATLLIPRWLVAQESQTARPKVLAFFTPGGELDHFLFAQQAMRAFGASHAVSPDEVNAFAMEIIKTLQPDVLVKGADWPADQIVGRDTVEARGGRVVRVTVEQGYSTSALVQKIRAR